MTSNRPQRLYGIGEWYGHPFMSLTRAERRTFAELQLLPKVDRRPQVCPFQSTVGKTVFCSKPGGVCSIRQYERVPDGRVQIAGELTATCPRRFEESSSVFSWIGETLLSESAPRVLGQIGFLRSRNRDVGRIDNVLVVENSQPLHWCAVEMQAVYFSGAGMADEFAGIASLAEGENAFPVARRRPDFRSSGPKRLMPQLQIKVPTLSMWGKKMAVVVDRPFFSALGTMSTVQYVSNCEIAWFVLKYEEDQAGNRLMPDTVYLTTLQSSVIGLTAGEQIDLESFEQSMLLRMRRSI